MNHRSHQSGFMRGVKYSNLFAFLAVIFLFTSCSFWGIPQKVLGEEIPPNNGNGNTNSYNPLHAMQRVVSTQFTDTDIIMTTAEIKSIYDTITEDLEKRKVHNLEELQELHLKKLATEETYYENLQKIIDSYYFHLIEKNSLAIDFTSVKHYPIISDNIKITENNHIRNFLDLTLIVMGGY